MEKLIDKATYQNIKPVGSTLGILYGLRKVQNETKNGKPPFRLILSPIGTPTHKLPKFLLLFLTQLTENKYTVRDSFCWRNLY